MTIRLGGLSIAAVMTGAFFSNINAGFDSATGGNCLVSLCYILYWAVFPKLFGNSRGLMKTAEVISNLTFVAAWCSMVCTQTGGDGFIHLLFFIPSQIGAVTTVPFSGLKFLVPDLYNGYTVYYPAILLLLLIWVLYMRWNMKKQNRL